MAPYGTALKKCFTGFSFSGRASRLDYWFAMTLLVPITSLTGILGGISIVLQSAIGIIFFACLSIPFSYLGYTLAARRLNDIGFPGKIAIFGFVVYLTCAFLVLLSSLNVALDLFNSSQLFTIEITELLLNSLVLIPLSIFSLFARSSPRRIA